MPFPSTPLPDSLADRPFGTTEARAVGVSRSRLRQPDLSVPFVGVRSTQTASGPLQLVDAYLPIMGEQEFFSHATAGLLWGFWLPRALETDPQIDVSVRKPARAPRHASVRGHHLVDRPHLIETEAGRRLSGICETWCQLGTVLGTDDLVAAGDWIVRKEVGGRPEELDRLVALANDPNRPYHVRLGRAAALVRCGARSRPETHLRLLLQRAGLPEPEVNGDLYDGTQWIAECDLVYRQYRVVVEYEGDGHIEKKQFRKDIDRYELLQALGWRVIRVHADELYRDPAKTVARVRAALAAAA